VFTAIASTAETLSATAKLSVSCDGKARPEGRQEVVALAYLNDGVI